MVIQFYRCLTIYREYVVCYVNVFFIWFISYKKSLLHLELFEHWKYYKLYICSLLYVYMLFNLQSLSVAYKMLCCHKS